MRTDLERLLTARLEEITAERRLVHTALDGHLRAAAGHAQATPAGRSRN